MGINKDVLMGLHLHFTDFHGIENGFSWLVCYSGCFWYIKIMLARFSFHSVGFFFWGAAVLLRKTTHLHVIRIYQDNFLSSLPSFP